MNIKKWKLFLFDNTAASFPHSLRLKGHANTMLLRSDQQSLVQNIWQSLVF